MAPLSFESTALRQVRGYKGLCRSPTNLHTNDPQKTQPKCWRGRRHCQSPGAKELRGKTGTSARVPCLCGWAFIANLVGCQGAHLDCNAERAPALELPSRKPRSDPSSLLKKTVGERQALEQPETRPGEALFSPLSLS